AEEGAAGPDRDARRALAHAELFHAAAPETLEALAAAARPRRYRAGEVDILAAGGPGREVSLATLGPGACVGEVAVLGGRPRSATVRARTDVLAYSLDGAALRA